jgi:hypothetical protein
MRDKFLISILIFYCAISLNCAKEADISECSLAVDNDSLKVTLRITNIEKESIFVPIQYWDVNILKDGNSLLAIPNKNYSVNCIYIYLNKYETLRSRGSKQNFPIYEKLPGFIKIEPDSVAIIQINIPADLKLNDISNYKVDVTLSYYFEDTILKSIKYSDNYQDDYMFHYNKSLNMKNGHNNLIEFQSDITCDFKYFLEEYKTVNFFCN